ncbi:peroxidase family protein [Calothrix sp. 336/3]|uniref:peroxidase family protein n=1 Tax=Calothrix sp. 336/3 TaxID=1337936 RepID=UPI0004E40547|nr:heme peroxidase family protein [Calothrix sp. 336/3]AKG21636.1 peroxidase [Calothrix sp. 336/3]
MQQRHGFGRRTGENQPLGEFSTMGKFGRMFPRLPAFTPTIESLTALGNAMNDLNPNAPAGDNLSVPAGFTYLGQFIDHDITFDTTALQEIMVDPLAVRNFRTPMLDLDSIYGGGPEAQPYLYQLDDPDLFLIGTTNETPGAGDPTIPTKLPNDLPRAQSTLGIIGDPRNDENLIVAQMHLAFLKFHNKVVADIRNGNIKSHYSTKKSIFEQARELVIWHYQWIVIYDFLARVIDKEQLERVIKQGRRFFNFQEQPFIPVEFSVAAYRLGHSMIRADYDYNRVFTPLPGGVTSATLELLFAFTAKSGKLGDFANIPIPSDWIIDWRRFFEIDSKITVNPSRKLDPFLVDPLKNLPNVPAPNSLAVRNLLRGRSMGLPSGQSVARLMRAKTLTPSEIAQGADGAVAVKFGLDVESPLWYYILKEAQIQAQGLRLGQVGSRILAEVFIGILEADSSSFLARCPGWKPTLPARIPGTFTMVDLLNFVGDINPIG